MHTGFPARPQNIPGFKQFGTRFDITGSCTQITNYMSKIKNSCQIFVKKYVKDRRHDYTSKDDIKKTKAMIIQ